tara:strand:- start:104 stop:433 length:330 start_codon:yes stop_codon:yes gene_type:complete
MINKKFILLIFMYLLFLVSIPIVKNKTRIIEKNIQSYENKITNLERNLFEAQLEFYYLSSPEVLSKNIKKYSNTNYTNLELSQIYLNIDHFISEQSKISRILTNEKKKK